MSKYQEYLKENKEERELIAFTDHVNQNTTRKAKKIIINKSKDKNAKVGETYTIVHVDPDGGLKPVLSTDKGVQIKYWDIEFDEVFG